MGEVWPSSPEVFTLAGHLAEVIKKMAGGIVQHDDKPGIGAEGVPAFDLLQGPV